MVKLLEILIFVYGLGALIVKTFPTIPAKYPWLISILTLLGNITNRQTDDAAVRAAAK
jgi:hypothetical protein